MDWAKTSAIWDEHQLSFVIWGILYYKFYSSFSGIFQFQQRKGKNNWVEEIFWEVCNLLNFFVIRAKQNVPHSSFYALQGDIIGGNTSNFTS